MPRIVHITDSYPPHRHPIAEQVAGLARHQGGQGDAVHVLTATPLEAAEPGKSRFRASATDAPGVRVHRLASRLAFGRPVLPRGRATIERALRLLRPDVVHLHLTVVSPFGYDAARASRGLDLPLVITWYSVLDGPEALARFGLRVAGWQSAPFVPSGASEAITASVARAFSREDARLIPLGTDLEPWLRRTPAPPASPADLARPRGLRVLINALDDRGLAAVHGALAARTELAAPTALAESGLLDITVTGAAASGLPSDLLGEVTVIPDAPAEVLPILARDHDVYISAGALDPHAAGARAAGIDVLAFSNTSGADTATVVEGAAELAAALTAAAHESSVRAIAHPAAATSEEGSWASVIAHARAAYRAAKDQSQGVLMPGKPTGDPNQ